MEDINLEELAESFVNGNIGYVREQINIDRSILIDLLNCIKEYYPSSEEYF